ncbi:MAG: hypothetical protein WBD32_07400 [Acidobacteriaceae bacterium]
MAKTSVGLFKTEVAADEVAREIEAAGMASDEVRLLREPLAMPGRDVLSIPGIDFAAALSRDLVAIGATETEAQAYVKAVRRGGVLVFATGSAEQVDGAAQIMNRHSAAQVEELSGSEPSLPVGELDNVSVLTGGGQYPEGGARIFVW